jgi:hypothetical protein
VILIAVSRRVDNETIIITSMYYNLQSSILQFNVVKYSKVKIYFDYLIGWNMLISKWHDEEKLHINGVSDDSVNNSNSCEIEQYIILFPPFLRKHISYSYSSFCHCLSVILPRNM